MIIEAMSGGCGIMNSNGNFIRYGTYKGKQIWLDKATGIRHVDNGALPGRKTRPEQVGAAVGLFYSGLSINEISRNQVPIFDTSAPSKATVYEWVTDYTKLALKEANGFKAQTGNTWVCDEQMQKIGGKKAWVWTVMDVDTRYILASHISPTRTIRDVVVLFGEAKRNSANLPKRVITDGMPAYPDGIERVFGGNVRHVTSGGIRAETNNNLSERLQGTIRQRTKVMRGMHSPETARMVMDGWTLHYNYFRLHEALGNKTPASKADIQSPFANWEDVARMDVRPFARDRAIREQRRRERRLPTASLRVRGMGY